MPADPPARPAAARRYGAGKIVCRIVLWATVLLAVSGAIAAQPSEPTEGFRAEYLGDLAVLRRKVVGLAEAIPADRYDWRPAEGVRSTSEVLMHLAQTNVDIMGGLGRPSPDDLSGELEAITAKVDVVAALKTSFREVRETVLGIEDAGLDRSVDFFGRTWSARALLYLASTHMHEHLGQSIAYARSNGIVPPWSASARAAGDGS